MEPYALIPCERFRGAWKERNAVIGVLRVDGLITGKAPAVAYI
jgi:hypothetical protein